MKKIVLGIFLGLVFCVMCWAQTGSISSVVNLGQKIDVSLFRKINETLRERNLTRYEKISTEDVNFIIGERWRNWDKISVNVRQDGTIALILYEKTFNSIDDVDDFLDVLNLWIDILSPYSEERPIKGGLRSIKPGSTEGVMVFLVERKVSIIISYDVINL
jgi:hypothetical protein